MSGKMESMLRILGDMRRFEKGEAAVRNVREEELSEDALELVAAARQEVRIPDFLKETEGKKRGNS